MLSITPARSLRRARRILVATGLAVVALPAMAAQAAEVTAAGTEIVIEDRSGRASESNRIVAEALAGGELRLVDRVPLVVKAPTCVNVTSLEVRCVRPSTSPISKLTIRAFGDHDQLRVAGSLPIRYEGGSGDDTYFGARTAAKTKVDFAGGDGNDFATYAAGKEGVIVDKDQFANDGRSILGDRDNVRSDVEGVTGTQFGDTLVGGSGMEEFIPLGGNDDVFGGDLYTLVHMGTAKDGADRIVGRGLFGTDVSYAKRVNPIRAAVDLGGADDGEAGEGDELIGLYAASGGSAKDVMVVAEGTRGISFSGGAGADTIAGNNHRDVLTGGPGADLMVAKGGNDQLNSNDGEPVDTVLCGVGVDTAKTDAAEASVADCETRQVS